MEFRDYSRNHFLIKNHFFYFSGIFLPDDLSRFSWLFFSRANIMPTRTQTFPVFQSQEITFLLNILFKKKLFSFLSDIKNWVK